MSRRCEICETTVPVTCDWCPCCDWPVSDYHEDDAEGDIIVVGDDAVIL